jgi:hypothetical protein
MASMDYWATAPIAREQATLLAPTLDSMIAGDAQVRLFDEVLAGIDWTEWEAVTAFNLGKLVRELTRLRAEFAILTTGTEE